MVMQRPSFEQMVAGMVDPALRQASGNPFSGFVPGNNSFQGRPLSGTLPDFDTGAGYLGQDDLRRIPPSPMTPSPDPNYDDILRWMAMESRHRDDLWRFPLIPGPREIGMPTEHRSLPPSMPNPAAFAKWSDQVLGMPNLGIPPIRQQLRPGMWGMPNVGMPPIRQDNAGAAISGAQERSFNPIPIIGMPNVGMQPRIPNRVSEAQALRQSLLPPATRPPATRPQPGNVLEAAAWR